MIGDRHNRLMTYMLFHGTHSSASSASRILASIRLRMSLRRYSLRPELIKFYVELGQDLETVLIQPRLDVVRMGSGSTDGEGLNRLKEETKDSPAGFSSSSYVNTNRLDFDQRERKLWSAHVKLCLTISRGNAAYKRFFGHKSFIGSASDKVSILKAIAFTSTVGLGKGSGKRSSKPWNQT